MLALGWCVTGQAEAASLTPRTDVTDAWLDALDEFAELELEAAMATCDEAIARARHAGARYIVIDERYTAQMAPALQPLLNPENAPPSLSLLRADLSPYAKARIVIYRLSPDDSTTQPS